MDVKIDVRGLEEFVSAMPDVVDRVLRETATDIVTDIKLSFNTSPAGRTYKRGARTHVASQAGYAPNVDTGMLRNSIRWQKVDDAHYEVVDGVRYGYMLETGTGRIVARPFVQPVFEAYKDKVGDKMKEALK